jgi:DNA-binding transcriptional ArsR family regulator
VAALIPAASGKHVGLRHLLLLPPEETVDRVTGLLRRFAETCFADRDDTAAVLDRDADAKRALARTMPPERLVEIATNGVTFSVQPEMAGVVLVPSIVVRPWVIITEHEGLRIFCYSVADEHIEADPAAPPSWLVQVYKALGDERRLRLLNRLAESNASLAELADEVDLAKSTVHHHLRTLRAAGLVRVTVGDDREYSLRRDTVPEAARLLEVYLTRSPGDASGAGTDLNRGVGS